MGKPFFIFVVLVGVGAYFVKDFDIRKINSPDTYSKNVREDIYNKKDVITHNGVAAKYEVGNCKFNPQNDFQRLKITKVTSGEYSIDYCTKYKGCKNGSETMSWNDFDYKYKLWKKGDCK